MWKHEARNQEAPPSRRPHRGIFVIGLLLALMIAGAAWYAYPILQRRNTSFDESLKELPSVELPSVKERVSALGDQLKQAGENVDRKFAAWASQQAFDHKSLREESAGMARDLKSRIEATESKFEQVGAEISEKMDRVVTRVTMLESFREADRKQIADLEQDLSQMRQQVSEQSAELAEVYGMAQDTTIQAQIAALRQDQDLARHDIGVLQNNLAVDKVTFEASKGRPSEVTEGISLYVSGTDPSYRRADGWLWVAADRRNIWLRNQSAQEPLTFYGIEDGQKRELVLTNVSATGVTGYLLVPKASAAPSSAQAAGQ